MRSRPRTQTPLYLRNKNPHHPFRLNHLSAISQRPGRDATRPTLKPPPPTPPRLVLALSAAPDVCLPGTTTTHTAHPEYRVPGRFSHRQFATPHVRLRRYHRGMIVAVGFSPLWADGPDEACCCADGCIGALAVTLVVSSMVV
ncbi:hypothetical protein BO71DRAFT_399929 [Aspergillus ellipticus CBS 707.79]|uniref:Uncharacterized protein n=1 Tax=Aspergillus ellipticus CBS 707.79 TaxID=1448320 RepID=A0A319DY82_9EURO|nr:hypothetical protein BO71DRAFT_399929 [Aspergillus ellipticus CBS 707.79]